MKLKKTNCRCFWQKIYYINRSCLYFGQRGAESERGRSEKPFAKQRSKQLNFYQGVSIILSKISECTTKGFHIIFPLFFFSVLFFCGYTWVNNLFHLSFLCLILILTENPVLCRQLFGD
ncbi:MAG: hypothetical protein HNEKOMLI_00669 [Sodalis sp. Psp]|nr:hypothetical protein [Sodalis sp. Psp]MCR3757135.1 hypothetical protein [Sodalis sp. Ppy]